MTALSPLSRSWPWDQRCRLPRSPERLGRIALGQFADIVLVDGTTTTITIDKPQVIADA